MDDKAKKVLDRLRGLCSRRDYCVADIRKKALTGLDGDMSAVQEVVSALVADKYVDDLRYASAYARDKASIQGWGAVKIRYMLSSKGLASDVISAALEDIDEHKASDRLYRLLEVKYRSLKDDPQCCLKMLRYGMGRGYGYEETNSIIRILQCRNTGD